MNDIWPGLVREEQQLDFPAGPKGLSTESYHLVKLIGSLDAPICVVTSYPTLDPHNSMQLRYNTIDNVSNVCCFNRLAKLRFHHATLRTSELLALKVFPRRLDRKLIQGASFSMSILSKVLAQLRRFWVEAFRDLLAKVTSPMILISGHQARKSYENYLQTYDVDTEVVWLTGSWRHEDELLVAWIERLP
jgi:hypothetical protein